MKHLLIFILVVSTLASICAAVSFDTTDCNSGNFFITNEAANKVTYSGKATEIQILPETYCVLSALTSTNSTVYTATGHWYTTGATIPLTANNGITLKKGKYDTINMYVSTTGAVPTTVNFIFND